MLVLPSEIFEAAQGPAESEYPLTWDGLVGLWTPLGNSPARDWSGKGNHGTYNGGMESAVPSERGLVWGFDGVGDYVNCGNPTAFDFADTRFTVCLWLKTVATVNTAPFSKASGGTSGWLCQMSTVGLVVGIIKTTSGFNSALRYSVNAYNDGLWHHVAIVYTTDTIVGSNNDVAIYVDGVADYGANTGTGAVYAVSTDNVLIGTRTGSLPFAGSLADIRIYGRALSADQIFAIAQGANPLIRRRRNYRIGFGEAGGVVHEVSGAIAGSTTIGGAAVLIAAAAGAVAGSTTVSGSAACILSAGGAINGTSGVECSAVLILSAAGQIDGLTILTGDLTSTEVPVECQIDGSTTVTGSAVLVASVSGAIAGSTVMVGSVVIVSDGGLPAPDIAPIDFSGAPANTSSTFAMDSAGNNFRITLS